MKCRAALFVLLTAIIGTFIGLVFFFSPFSFIQFGIFFGLVCALLVCAMVFVTSLESGIQDDRSFRHCKILGKLLSILIAIIVLLSIPALAFFSFSIWYIVLKFVFSYVLAGIIIGGTGYLMCVVDHS